VICGPAHGERRSGQPGGFLDLAGEQIAGGYVAHQQAVLLVGRRSDRGEEHPRLARLSAEISP
jgi:hypothetical protein